MVTQVRMGALRDTHKVHPRSKTIALVYWVAVSHVHYDQQLEPLWVDLLAELLGSWSEQCKERVV